MAIDFAKLKGGNQFAALQKKLEQSSSGGYKVDQRFWKPKPNADKKFEGEIRLLSIAYVDYVGVEEGKYTEDSLSPVAKIISHTFQGTNGWFIENSLQTFSEDCPVKNWSMPEFKIAKENNDDKRKTYLKQFLPREKLICNVYVIKDGNAPENNGKIFLYEIPKTIFKMIEKADKPEFEDDESFDPFDMIAGKPLKLRITYDVKSFGGKENLSPNFAAVTWGKQGSLFEDDAAMEAVWKKQYSLSDFYDRKHFKTFEELETKFNKVMGFAKDGAPAQAGSTLGKEATAFLSTTKSEPEPSMPSTPTASEVGGEVEEEEDADNPLAEWQRLLAGG